MQSVSAISGSASQSERPVEQPEQQVGGAGEGLRQAIVVDAEKVRGHVDEVVRSTVEATLNQLLEEEADRIAGAGRYERHLQLAEPPLPSRVSLPLPRCCEEGCARSIAGPVANAAGPVVFWRRRRETSAAFAVSGPGLCRELAKGSMRGCVSLGVEVIADGRGREVVG